jgi:hypothetical protein
VERSERRADVERRALPDREEGRRRERRADLERGGQTYREERSAPRSRDSAPYLLALVAESGALCGKSRVVDVERRAVDLERRAVW